MTSISELFEWRYMLIPLSISNRRIQYTYAYMTYRVLRVFGLRIAVWNTTNLNQ